MKKKLMLQAVLESTCELPGFRGCAPRRRDSGKRRGRLKRGEDLSLLFIKYKEVQQCQQIRKVKS